MRACVCFVCRRPMHSHSLAECGAGAGARGAPRNARTKRTRVSAGAGSDIVCRCRCRWLCSRFPAASASTSERRRNSLAFICIYMRIVCDIYARRSSGCYSINASMNDGEIGCERLRVACVRDLWYSYPAVAFNGLHVQTPLFAVIGFSSSYCNEPQC